MEKLTDYSKTNNRIRLSLAPTAHVSFEFLRKKWYTYIFLLAKITTTIKYACILASPFNSIANTIITLITSSNNSSNASNNLGLKYVNWSLKLTKNFQSWDLPKANQQGQRRMLQLFQLGLQDSQLNRYILWFFELEKQK